MLFTALAIALAAIVAAFMLVTMLRGRRGDGPAAAYDLQVYREQLEEVDRDLARGIITEDEAARIRTEVSRRVLEADRKLAAQKAAGQAPQGISAAAGGLVMAALLGGGWFIYSQIGAPGYPDLPLQERVTAAEEARENRPSQAQAEANAGPLPALEAPEPDHLKLVEQLREVVAERQNDLRGFLLLARNEAALGNFDAAHKAQARAIELKQGRATAEDYGTLADMMVIAAGGYVSPEAEEALRQALGRDPDNGIGLYYWGLMHLQTGRPDIAFNVWRKLLTVSERGDPWLTPVRSRMEELAWQAGVQNYQLPPLPQANAPLRGPSAEDMEAAADMTPEQRQQMIQGMVANLSERLATQGGTPQEWAQLIRALGILGDTQQAGAIWTEAQQVFAQHPDALELVRGAAVDAGVAQ
ncbi:c-type cytochrome biogenesis protein CcmI [Rhodovulum adriaticum]|uniref:Cytochrome c-type biogenesis protein CcmH n=1 Tax=Rhodovulum adriaticum TaxID=35804 RepID=A0A4R2NV20_RHOAD|nr:c-type cytochrome biogenesis protein CcmI [Rhodovulum adriaticum]MBK1635940.1 c-type cytochrome biogenesis protein CcmI [Rhodovulum adriaticum]TCP25398.1 cytochrome c-type biogenesis protein CcmH [Rhodovulum adriaticum]